MLRNVRTFIYVDADQDRNADWSGWRMEGMDHFDPGESYTIAHDALEHFEKNETTLEQEMMAFGSMILMRVMGGWWQSENSYHAGREHEIIADDIARFLSETGWTIKPRKGCRINEDIAHMVVDRDYFQHTVLGNDYHEREGYKGRKAAYDTYIHCMRWVSKGYAKARRRWAGNSEYELRDLFINVTRAVEKYKHAEHGDKLTIAFSCKTLEFRVFHQSYYELEENQW